MFKLWHEVKQKYRKIEETICEKRKRKRNELIAKEEVKEKRSVHWMAEDNCDRDVKVLSNCHCTIKYKHV